MVSSHHLLIQACLRRIRQTVPRFWQTRWAAFLWISVNTHTHTQSIQHFFKCDPLWSLYINKSPTGCLHRTKQTELNQTEHRRSDDWEKSPNRSAKTPNRGQVDRAEFYHPFRDSSLCTFLPLSFPGSPKHHFFYSVWANSTLRYISVSPSSRFRPAETSTGTSVGHSRTFQASFTVLTYLSQRSFDKGGLSQSSLSSDTNFHSKQYSCIASVLPFATTKLASNCRASVDNSLPSS